MTSTFDIAHSPQHTAAWDALEGMSRELRSKTYPAGFDAQQASQVEAALRRAWDELDAGDIQLAAEEARTAVQISEGIDQEATRYARRQERQAT
jgi:hypothetical protein